MSLGMVVAAASAAGASPTQTLAERIEMVNWTDPERAEQLIDAESTAGEKRSADPRALEVQGMVYADVHRDDDVDAILAILQAQSGRGIKAAVVAGHYVRAYSLYQRDQYAAAGAEVSQIDIDSLPFATERYRVSLLRGNSLRLVGQAEAALPYLERALDLAHEMHDELRSLHAMLWLARIYLNTGNLDHASAQLEAARLMADSLGDEAALVEIEGCVSDVADRRGDHAAERRASLAALDHARQSGSSKWLAHALINLGDSYLKSHDYMESLKYSKRALPMVMKLRESGNEPIVMFNEGLAYIGVGNIRPGEKLAEAAIAKSLEGNNLLSAKELLREYADALEQAGYLMMAIQVFHRYDEANQHSMTETRQRVFLELSAKYADERRARELELLRRDNALKASEMHGQRLQFQLLAAVVGFVTCICIGLTWMVAKVRRVNSQLRFDSERDALTGLRNRRYFNEHVLTVDGARPAEGCVLLADLDHFKKINDTLGHPAGDAVLATASHRLSAALRESDKLVRWGGEEFLAVLHPITAEQADITVERLLQAMRTDPVLWNGEAIECTISIGYACFPMSDAGSPISLESAIGLVDKALYEAKRRGRDRACLITSLNAHDECDVTEVVDRQIRPLETDVAA